jgi:hypothetical protein
MPAERDSSQRLDSFDEELECLPLIRLLKLGDFGIDRAVGTILPVRRVPARNGPSKATPNKIPNWAASETACHTRVSEVRSRTDFSMRSGVMSNPLVARLCTPVKSATQGLRLRAS